MYIFAEEEVQQPRVEHAGGDHRPVGQRAMREPELREYARQAEADYPHIEAHADSPERLRIEPAYRPRAERNAGKDAGNDQPGDLKALRRKQPEVVVRNGGQHGLDDTD